jgi:hypothetical protein
MSTKQTFIAKHCPGACLAAKFAQEIGLPSGNLWEPGIARSIDAYIREGHDVADVEDAFRLRLGLAPRS